MYLVGGCLAIGRSLVLLLALAIIVAVASSCQERRGGERQVTGTVPPQTQQVPDESSTASQEARDMAVNRIAYVGPDGNIFTINPDGTDSRRLTTSDPRVGSAGHFLAQMSAGQVRYFWPTWSPDSTRLAASRVRADQSGTDLFLDVIDASTGNVATIYENAPNTGLVARGDPHYTYWSPDSRHLVFLASTPEELTMFWVTPEEEGDPVRLTGESPIYFHWSADSSKILMHRGEELLLSLKASDGLQSPVSLGTVGGAFRAPALSRDSTTMAYVVERSGSQALYLADAGSQVEDVRPLMDVGPISAFMWSPTREEIAIAETTSPAGPLFERLTLVSSDGAVRKTLVSKPLLAFFWSPKGDRIAYVALGPEQRSFTWNYVDTAGGSPVELIEFIPSQAFLTLYSFFDQYAYSNSVWSPDGSQIVFAGTVGPSSLSSNGTSPPGDKVYVLDIVEGASPREIATGAFATWSWK